MREQIVCANCHRLFFSTTMKVQILIEGRAKDGRPIISLTNTKIGKRVSYLVTNYLPREARTIIDNTIEVIESENMSEATVEVPMEILCQRCANWIRQKMEREKHPKTIRIIPMKKEFEFLKT